MGSLRKDRAVPASREDFDKAGVFSGLPDVVLLKLNDYPITGLANPCGYAPPQATSTYPINSAE